MVEGGIAPGILTFKELEKLEKMWFSSVDWCVTGVFGMFQWVKTDDFCVRKLVGGIIFMFGKSTVVFASGG